MTEPEERAPGDRWKFPEVPGGSAHDWAPEIPGMLACCTCGFIPAFNRMYLPAGYVEEVALHIRYERTLEIIAGRTEERRRDAVRKQYAGALESPFKGVAGMLLAFNPWLRDEELAKLHTPHVVSLVERVNEALARASCVDGAHHKQWVIDQMVRALAGDGYDDWVREFEHDGDTEGEKVYVWDQGIAP